MKAQISKTMRDAMRNMLDEIGQKNVLDEKDVDWMRRLCLELRDRINKLTPSRHDLHVSLNTGFDVDLLVQMMQHQAVDPSDMQNCMETIIRRLAMLCAPVQDEEIAELLVMVQSGKCHVGHLLVNANRIVDEIEDMQSQPEAVAFAAAFSAKNE